MTAITVILPVYNGGERLLISVASIINQDFEDWRLLILDDGSTDGAVSKIEKLKDSRVEIFNGRENLGLTLRLNQGIDAATSKYIARMDADDMSFKYRFKEQIEFLEQNPTVHLVGCKAVTFNDQYELGRLLSQECCHDEIVSMPWRGIQIAHPTWMGKTAWFKKYRYGLPEFRRAEDQELLLRSYKESHFANLKTVHFAYNWRPTRFETGLTERLSVVRFQTEQFISNREIKNLILGYIFSIFKLTLYSFISLSSKTKQKLAYKGKAPTQDISREFYGTLEDIKKLLEKNGL